MSGAPREQPSPWQDALMAAAMLAVDPEGLGGIHLKAAAGPVRERWLDCAQACFAADAPKRRIAAGVAEARLVGGLDIGRTLEAGRPVVERGVMAAAHGGLLVVAMAERLTASAVGILCGALDTGAVKVERDGISRCMPARFGLIALDESAAADEALAPALGDRLGLRLDLDGVGWRMALTCRGESNIGAARALLPRVEIPDGMSEAFCAAAEAAGIGSIRAPLQAMRAARCIAALRGSTIVGPEDAVAAIRLVLGIRLQPAPPSEPPEDDPQEQEMQPDFEQEPPASGAAAADMLVNAVKAALPDHILEKGEVNRQRRNARAPAGKAGASAAGALRGRAVGTVEKPPAPGARLDVLATLRQAAPWQKLRLREAGAGIGAPRLSFRKQDFRFTRFREKTGTTAIFAVDASGSAAVERLAETKGAIELLLAQCYVRRDSVALIAFRGKAADTLLEPTRSLVRAKRALSALPGGGGTPLAAGIVALSAMAETAARKGRGVVAVLLTDGRGNVGLDGTSLRERVAEDTSAAARAFRAAAIRAVLVDTAQRPQARARALANDLGAEYLALPRGQHAALAREVDARMEG